MGGVRLGPPGVRGEQAAVKICGVTQPEHLAASVEAGARYVGFNFVPKSPRYVTPQQAADLAFSLPADLIFSKVGLWVDPSNETLAAALAVAPIDIVQLHGHESPERVAEIRAKAGLPVMKAVPIADETDLAAIETYSEVADLILVDAKPPKGAALTGGGGETFDWSLLEKVSWRRPWMLAGGLTPENVVAAIRATSAPVVDVSSGVEATRGVKDAAKIHAFLNAVSAA